jgi:hypothetical protein
VRFVVLALIASGDNGLNGILEFEEPDVLEELGVLRCKTHTSDVETSGRMPVDRKTNALALAALLASVLVLGGCSTSIADLPLVGTPADAPERPKETGAYLPVHDLPPDRAEPELPPAERAKIAAELLAARDRQASTGAAKDAAAK